MTTKIIWIFGSSAAGKGTLMRQLLNDTNKELIRHFDLERYTLVGLEESTKWIMQFTDDPIAEKRKQFPELLKGLIKPGSAVLIKGQDVDLEYNTPTIVRELFPEASHEIIFLSLPLDDIFIRCQRKSWWEEGIDSKENLKKWLVDQINEITKLKGFTLKAYDSSTEQYQSTFFPPQIYE